jgi:hypothetical protein
VTGEETAKRRQGENKARRRDIGKRQTEIARCTRITVIKIL